MDFLQTGTWLKYVHFYFALWSKNRQLDHLNFLILAYLFVKSELFDIKMKSSSSSLRAQSSQIQLLKFEKSSDLIGLISGADSKSQVWRFSVIRSR